MNPQKRWECQECFRLHGSEEDAFNCHPPKLVYVCNDCSTQYTDIVLARHCCSYGAGPYHYDIERIKNIKLDDDE